MDDRYIIDTPENIDFAYDIAGIGSRFLAAIIDSLLLVSLEIMLGVVAGVVLSQARSGQVSALESIVLAVWSLLAFLFLWGYYLVFELLWNGQSPGKRLIGLRVVRVGGRPITFISSAIRNLIRIVDFLPGFYGIGVVTMFIDSRARRLGDLAAGTLVVKEGRAVTLESLTARTVGSSSPPLPLRTSDSWSTPTLQNIHILTAQDYELVQAFLVRRVELSRESRARLASQLASSLRERLGLPASGDPELFLEYVVGQYRLSKAEG